MNNKTQKFDVPKYVDSPESIKEYLEIMLEENGIEGFQRTLGHVEKAVYRVIREKGFKNCRPQSNF